MFCTPRDTSICQASSASAITAYNIIKALISGVLSHPVSQSVFHQWSELTSEWPDVIPFTPREVKLLGRKKATGGIDAALGACIPCL